MKIMIDREKLEQTIEVLRKCWYDKDVPTNTLPTIHKLTEALNTPVPVGYITVWGPDKVQFTECVGAKLADLEQKVFPVYIEPLQREWVSLTDEQIEQLSNKAFADYYMADNNYDRDLAFARAIEAALKERNHE